MKKIITTLLFLQLIFNFCFAQSNNYAVFLPEKTIFNAGKIQLNDTLKISILFTNDGSTPLIIQNVKTHCSCTSVEFPPSPILPGKKDQLKVKIIPNSTGRFIKELSIYSNSVSSPDIVRIKANVKL